MKGTLVTVLLSHIVSIFIFLLILKKFDAISSIYTSRASLFLEMPLAIIIYYAFFFILRPGVARFVIAAMPVLMLYTIGEIYYRSFGSAFKLVAIKQLPALVRILSLPQSLGIIVCLTIPAIVMLAFVNYSSRTMPLRAGLFIILIAVSIELKPAIFLSLLQTAGAKVGEHSDIENIRSNGRMTMTLYWEAKRSHAIRRLKSLSIVPDDGYAEDVARRLSNLHSKPNIYLIVLESFFDPGEFSKVQFSHAPLHPMLLSAFDGGRGLSESPVFGGLSAQAEFEVLSGVPAFGEFDEIEFNVFGTGYSKACLPALLSQAGYLTIASNAFRPEYFNSDIAYNTMGFKEVYYPREYAPARKAYFEHGDIKQEGFLFDGDLLQKNLEFISGRIRAGESRPIFDYVLGLYGHYPFRLDERKRPPFIKATVPSGIQTDIIERLANQMYYRSEAVASFAARVSREDSKAIIIVLGDHLPNLEAVDKMDKGYMLYQHLRYLDGKPKAHMYVPIFAMSAGQALPLKNISHHNVSEIILNCLMDGGFFRDTNCFKDRKEYFNRYLNIMASSMGTR
jgi:phosphoglycerol transferase MdoB-like AlkP superfamily enzyme